WRSRHSADQRPHRTCNHGRARIMQVEEFCWSETSGWTVAGDGATDLILYFGTRDALADGARYRELRQRFPGAHIVGCSTGGQIRNDDVCDHEIAAARLKFDATRLR